MGGQEGLLGDLGSQQEMRRLLKAGRPIGERESFSSDLSRLNIGKILPLGSGAWPSFVCGRRSGFVRRQLHLSIWFDSWSHLQTRFPTFERNQDHQIKKQNFQKQSSSHKSKAFFYQKVKSKGEKPFSNL